MAQDAADLLVERTERGGLAEPLAVGRVHDDDAARIGWRGGVGELADAEVDGVGDAGALGVIARDVDGAAVLIEAVQRRADRPSALARFGEQLLVERGDVAEPAVKAE